MGSKLTKTKLRLLKSAQLQAGYIASSICFDMRHGCSLVA